MVLLKVCRRRYHCKIQVKFDINNHFDQVSFCWCVDIGFRLITFAGMHYGKFAEGYIIVKYWSGEILVIIRKVVAKLWPIFDLVFVVGVKYKVKILFPLNHFRRDALTQC